MAGYIGSKAVSVNTTSATISDDLSVGDDLTVTDDATIGGTLGVTGVLTATSLDISGDIDVDGTTNLDAVDIDGAVDMASTLTVADNVNISNGDLTITSTDAASTTAGPVLTLARDGASPEDNDLMGQILFKMDDDAGNLSTFAKIEVVATDVSNGSEDARIDFVAAKDDAFSAALSIAGQSVGIGATETGTALNVASVSGSVGTNPVQQWQYSTDTDWKLRLRQIVSSGLVKHTFDLTNAGTDYNNNLVLDRGNIGINIAPTTAYGRGLQIHDTGTAGANLRLTDSNTGSGTGNGMELIAINADNYIINREAGPIFKLINGNTVQKIDATGAITAPKTPAFRAHKGGTNQNNIATGSDVAITFGTEDFDQGGNFASSTFTAPVTGKYYLNASIRIDNIDSASPYYIIMLLTSNRSYRFIYDPDFGQDAVYWSTTFSTLADMDASDTAFIAVNQGGGTSQSDISGDAPYTHFSGFLAC